MLRSWLDERRSAEAGRNRRLRLQHQTRQLTHKKTGGSGLRVKAQFCCYTALAISMAYSEKSDYQYFGPVEPCFCNQVLHEHTSGYQSARYHICR